MYTIQCALQLLRTIQRHTVDFDIKMFAACYNVHTIHYSCTHSENNYELFL